MRNERDELVLHAVELSEPLVLLGQEPLDRLGLGTGHLLGSEKFFALGGLFVEATVARGQLCRQPVQDREERDIENEERDRENEPQSTARVADADFDPPIVLVELERADRLRRRGFSDRDQRLEYLDFLLAAPAH